MTDEVKIEPDQFWIGRRTHTAVRVLLVGPSETGFVTVQGPERQWRLRKATLRRSYRLVPSD